MICKITEKLYRAIDKHGKTLDFMLSSHRDKVAARLFFRRAIAANGVPSKIVIDKSGANLAGLQRINIDLKFSQAHQAIEILRVKYLNNIVEHPSRRLLRIHLPVKGPPFHQKGHTPNDGLQGFPFGSRHVGWH